LNLPGFLLSAEPKAFAFVGAFWAGLYTYAWFIGIGLSFVLYASLMPAASRMTAAK
jgi:NCS1 family nucleobase:cation symporter-1